LLHLMIQRVEGERMGTYQDNSRVEARLRRRCWKVLCEVAVTI
jgi:hypothetical protein